MQKEPLSMRHLADSRSGVPTEITPTAGIRTSTLTARY